MKPAANRAADCGSTTGLAFLNFPLSFAGEILKLPTGGLEGVADSHVDVVVGIRNVGIPADCDIGSPRPPGMQNLEVIGIPPLWCRCCGRPTTTRAEVMPSEIGSSFFQSSPMRVLRWRRDA